MSAVVGWALAVIFWTVVFWVGLYVMDTPRRKYRQARMKDLDECNRYARLAAAAIGKDDGEYEKNMRQAVYYFDKSCEEP